MCHDLDERKTVDDGWAEDKTGEDPLTGPSVSLNDDERRCWERFDTSPGHLRRHSCAIIATPPPEFFCPVSRRLMTEPVTLRNTGVTLSRTAMQAWLRTGSRVCPVTGRELSDWVVVESNDRLRASVRAWAALHGLDFELLDTAATLLAQLRGDKPPVG